MGGVQYNRNNIFANHLRILLCLNFVDMVVGASTISITTFSIMSLSIQGLFATLSKMTLSITTLIILNFAACGSKLQQKNIYLCNGTARFKKCKQLFESQHLLLL